ncbi:MAG: DUF4173 domain-containing protein [Oscillospiraceae bacterium]|nr:DUF4173 domain-containing protein [Oscillospiraceae bacterium]
METNQPEVSVVSGQPSAPQTGSATPERVPFAASRHEIIAALLLYPLAYGYVSQWASYSSAEMKLLLAGFTIGFVALTELLHRGVPRKQESWVWLGCALANLLSLLADRGQVWGDSTYAFLHIFAVWWVLSRSDTLLEGGSGHLLPLDALDGFVLFPFRHFFLRLRTIGFALSRLRGKRKKPEAETVVWSAVMSAAALGLLVWAANLLISADSGFAALLSEVVRLFRFEWDIDVTEFTGRFLLSLPVGAYLYGLLGGARREDKAALRRRSGAIAEQMEALRGVPERVWLVLMALFCALYALFFAVQGQYLFGAFAGAPAEGFSVAEYARQGFFELCKVMAVNFALLWLVTRSSREDVRRQKALRALCLTLLAESFLLAVVAFSKLALYISCFGFTPKRLQSTWLVCVLAFGCGCAAWSLAAREPSESGGRVFRVWMYFGAVTLSLLSLY